MKTNVAAASLLIAAAAFAQTPGVDGEVTKVDKAGGKLTLRHGEIRNLEMPAMTMAFRVADPKWLDLLQAGDKVRFAAAKVGGVYTVTAITKR